MPRVFYTPAMGKATMLRRYATVGEWDRWGVAAMMQQRFKPDPFTNTMFLFCGRRLDCIREFCRDRDGCILLYKL